MITAFLSDLIAPYTQPMQTCSARYTCTVHDVEFKFTLSVRANQCSALRNLCDLNPTSWVASVAQLVE